MAALFRERALRFVRGLTVAAWVRKQPRDQPYHLVSPIPVRVSGRNETCIPVASGCPFQDVSGCTRIRHIALTKSRILISVSPPAGAYGTLPLST